MKKVSIKEIALIGIMAAAVYVSSAFLQIPIPTAIDNTRLHMGNVMCLLSGLLLGAFLMLFCTWRKVLLNIVLY